MTCLRCRVGMKRSEARAVRQRHPRDPTRRLIPVARSGRARCEMRGRAHAQPVVSLLGHAPVAATLLRACVRVVDKSHGHARIGTAWHGCQFARCLCAAREALAVERLNVGAACIPRNTNAGDASWHVSIRPQPSCNTLFSPASARVTSFSVFFPNSFRQSACRLPIPDIPDAHKPIDLSAVCAQS